MFNEPKSILPHEWFALALYLTIFAFLTLISWLNGGPDNLEVKRIDRNKTLFAYVNGAVKKPGCHRVGVLATVKELLEQAEPLDDADLRKVDFSKEVKEGMKISIKRIKKITLQIENRIKGENEVLSVASGTKVIDLVKLLKLNADETILIDKRRKILRENDHIIIELKEK